jgi:large subunit ribosomal protein L15
MPLQMRLPKRGFKSIDRIDYVGINLSSLQHAVDKFNALDFNMDSMKKLSMVKKSDKVKILGNGELNSKISVSVHAISATAKEKIEALGGSVQLIK